MEKGREGEREKEGKSNVDDHHYRLIILHAMLLDVSSESIITLSVGAIVGFAMQNYTSSEGDTVNVCVTIHSPNQTVLDMSTVRGEFSISGSDGMKLHTHKDCF